MDLITLHNDRIYKHNERVFHMPTRKIGTVFEPTTPCEPLTGIISVAFFGSNRLEFIRSNELTHHFSMKEWFRALTYAKSTNLAGMAYFFNLACFVLSSFMAAEKEWSSLVAIPILVFSILMALDHNDKFIRPICILSYTLLVLALTIFVCGWM